MWDFTRTWFVDKRNIKSYVNDCFKINGEQIIKMPKNVNMLDWKIIEGN